MRRAAPRGSALFLVVALAQGMFLAPSVASAQTTPDERLILTPQPATTFRVQAVYSNTGVTCEAKRRQDLRARYRGKLEILRQSDGRIAIINHLTFDEYLRGLAEVPRSWPLETLKAQVIAARSYALYHLAHPRSSAGALGYDICSTDSCQVYRGVSVEQGAFGDAWIRAVTETSGRALLYRGDPIQAFYHSTSPGRTKRSFPGGTALPYLASVAGQDDDSPLARWTVRVPLAHLGPILDRAGDWPGGRVASVRLSGSTVSVAGSGRSVSIGKSSFRTALNSEAACAYPNAYPTAGSTGAKLPQTVPSIDFTMRQSGTSVVLTGRGWGHGVGMSQYGARSLAERGRKHADILSYYYAGLRPRSVTEPGRIRVLVVEDARLLRIGIEGKATVETSTGSALAPGDRFEVRGGPTLDVRRGVGPALAPVLSIEPATAPQTITPDGTIAVSYALSRPAKVVLILTRDGTEILRTTEVSQISGSNVLSVPLGAQTSQSSASPTSASPSPTPTGSASGSPTPVTTVQATPTTLAAGGYQMVLEAYDGLDRVRTAPIALTVEAPPAPGPLPPTPDAASGRGSTLVIAAAVLVLAGAGVFFVRRRGRPTP